MYMSKTIRMHKKNEIEINYMQAKDSLDTQKQKNNWGTMVSCI